MVGYLFWGGGKHGGQEVENDSPKSRKCIGSWRITMERSSVADDDDDDAWPCFSVVSGAAAAAASESGDADKKERKEKHSSEKPS